MRGASLPTFPTGAWPPQGSPQNTQSQPACLLNCVLGILRKAVLTFPTGRQPKGALWSSKEQRPVPCAGKAVNYVAVPWQTRQQSHGGIPAGGLSYPTTDSLPEHPLWASLGYTVSQSPDHSLTLLPKSKCLFYPRRMMSVAQLPQWSAAQRQRFWLPDQTISCFMAQMYCQLE